MTHHVQVVNKKQLIAAMKNVTSEFTPSVVVNLRKDGTKTTYRFSGGYTSLSPVHKAHMKGVLATLRKLPKEIFE